jgi:hypothetical protein
MRIRVQELWHNLVATTRRFPFAVLDAAVATVLALSLYSAVLKNTVMQDLLLTAILGFPLMMSFTLFAERGEWPERRRRLFPFYALLILAVCYFFLQLDEGEAVAIRFAALLLGFVCLLSFAPYVRKGSINAFWRFNKSLVIGFAIAGSATVALMAGIGVAFLGMDFLLGIKFPGNFYSRIWIVGSCFLWPLIFLATIPDDLAGLEAPEQYPKAMELFSRFIVVPLVLVYMLILYLYTGKIVIEASWPKGGVAGYVLGFSVLGLLSVVLMYPLKDREGNRWIGTYLKWLCICILPQTAILFLSVWRRVSEYGVTESRYFGVLAAFLLAGVCLYFLVSRTKNIKVLPITLCIAACLSAIGPWSALSISERSQFHRLELLLEKHGILSGGKVVKAKAVVPYKEQAIISAIVRYLNERHGLKSVQGLFTENFASQNAYGRPAKMLNAMGLSYMPYYSEGGSQAYYSFYSGKKEVRKISGYDYLLRIGSYETQEYSAEINNRNYTFSLRQNAAEFDVDRDGRSLMRLDIMPLARKLKERPVTPTSHLNVPQKEMVLEGRAGGVAIKVLFSEMHMAVRNERLELTGALADVLMKIE